MRYSWYSFAVIKLLNQFRTVFRSTYVPLSCSFRFPEWGSNRWCLCSDFIPQWCRLPSCFTKWNDNQKLRGRECYTICCCFSCCPRGAIWKFSSVVFQVLLYVLLLSSLIMLLSMIAASSNNDFYNNRAFLWQSGGIPFDVQGSGRLSNHYVTIRSVVIEVHFPNSKLENWAFQTWDCEETFLPCVWNTMSALSPTNRGAAIWESTMTLEI